eukprot:1136941-Pelagomonas_calceolata.AAC.8
MDGAEQSAVIKRSILLESRGGAGGAAGLRPFNAQKYMCMKASNFSKGGISWRCWLWASNLSFWNPLLPALLSILLASR